LLNDIDSDSEDCGNGPTDYDNRPSEKNAHSDSTFSADAEDLHTFDRLQYGNRVGPDTSNSVRSIYDSDSDCDSIPSLLEGSNDSDSGSDTHSSAPTIPFFRLSDTAVNDYPPDRFIDHLYADLQQDDHFVDSYDSLHFTPLNIAARSQRIQRNIFDSVHCGRYVVTVNGSIPFVGPDYFQYFLDPT
jgi:hypothetical protein